MYKKIREQFRKKKGKKNPPYLFHATSGGKEIFIDETIESVFEDGWIQLYRPRIFSAVARGLVMQNIRRPVRRTFSEPTSAVAKGLRDHVRLVATSVQPELALVVVCLSVTTANRHGRYVRWTRRRTNAVRATDLRTLAARIAFQLVARRRYRRYRVGCKHIERTPLNRSMRIIGSRIIVIYTRWFWQMEREEDTYI